MPQTSSYLNTTGEIGLFIRKRREEAKMTRETLSTKLGYRNPPSMISLLENRKAKFPIARWKDFADALSIPPHEMLEVVLTEAMPDALPYLSFHEGPGGAESSENLNEDTSEKSENEGEAEPTS